MSDLTDESVTIMIRVDVPGDNQAALLAVMSAGLRDVLSRQAGYVEGAILPSDDGSHVDQAVRDSDEKQVRSFVEIDPEFVATMPKAELHVHLEGTLEPAMMLLAGRRNDVELPWATVADIRSAYRFSSLEGFLEVLFRAAQVLRRQVDFYELTLGYLQRAAGEGIVRSEMFFGAQTFLDMGVPIAEQLDGVFGAMEDARVEWGIDGQVICTAQRHRTEADAIALLDLLDPWADRVLGVGLGSAELGNPAGKFARYFAQARARGYRTTVHAGEGTPVSYVSEALDSCLPDRIDHGVSAADDAAVVARLAATGTALTMCPLSNLALGVVPDLRSHPLRRLLHAGVKVTVNSDDPPFFGGYVNANYLAVAEALSLNVDDVMALAYNSFTASFAEPREIRSWLQRLETHRTMYFHGDR
jgi:adenosine deaminase